MVWVFQPTLFNGRGNLAPTIVDSFTNVNTPYEAALPRVESLGVPGDGWIRITLPNGREDIYCSPLEAGYQQLENIAFTGDATLIRHDSDGTLLDWAVIGGDNLQYRGEILPATRE